MTFRVGRYAETSVGKLARLSCSPLQSKDICGGIRVVSMMIVFMAIKKAVVPDES